MKNISTVNGNHEALPEYPQDSTVVMRRIQNARAQFAQDLPKLLRSNPGEWVAYRGKTQVAIAPSHHLLMKQKKVVKIAPEELYTARIEE